MKYPAPVQRRAEQILGYSFNSVGGERMYPVIDGVVYTDLFEETDTITIEGYTGKIKKAFNGRSNGVEYYNQLILDKCRLKEVTLDLSWGSACFNKDIDGLLAWLNDNPATDSLDNAGVASKKIEDFSVTHRTASDTSVDINIILNEGYGFYIRKLFIIDVAKEQKDSARYF